MCHKWNVASSSLDIFEASSFVSIHILSTWNKLSGDLHGEVLLEWNDSISVECAVRFYIPNDCPV